MLFPFCRNRLLSSPISPFFSSSLSLSFSSLLFTSLFPSLHVILLFSPLSAPLLYCLHIPSNYLHTFLPYCLFSIPNHRPSNIHSPRILLLSSLQSIASSHSAILPFPCVPFSPCLSWRLHSPPVWEAADYSFTSPRAGVLRGCAGWRDREVKGWRDWEGDAARWSLGEGQEGGEVVTKIWVTVGFWT